MINKKKKNLLKSENNQRQRDVLVTFIVMEDSGGHIVPNQY